MVLSRWWGEPPPSVKGSNRVEVKMNKLRLIAVAASLAAATLMVGCGTGGG